MRMFVLFWTLNTNDPHDRSPNIYEGKDWNNLSLSLGGYSCNKEYIH